MKFVSEARCGALYANCGEIEAKAMCGAGGVAGAGAEGQHNKNAYGNFMQIFIVAAICNKFQREIV